MKLNRFADKQITQAAARSQLQQLLAGCTDERLAGFTVEKLCHLFSVPQKLIEYDLTIARQRRSNPL